MYTLEESPTLDKLSNHRMLSNLLTLPAESISKGTEEHDRVLIFVVAFADIHIYIYTYTLEESLSLDKFTIT